MKPTENKMQEQPTAQSQIAAIKSMLPLKRAQLEMQEINTRLVELAIRELEGIAQMNEIKMKQNQMQAEQDKLMRENIVEHTITQEDLDMNPEMVEAGITLGQVIGIPKDIYKQVNLANKKDIEDKTSEKEAQSMKVVPAEG